MSLFLAVDGGQTTTRVVLADEQGRILGQTTGGPSDHTEEPGGPERLEQVILSAVGRVLSDAQLASLGGLVFAAACFGMTGETDIKRQILRRLIRTPHLSVVHDSVNALIGATAGQPGLIVISGTGSVARGMDARGREMRVGGWGHLFGDEGSAYFIGREAVRATTAEYDGFGAKTQLSLMFSQRLGISSPYELMAKYYSGALSRDHLAGLSVWVHEAAQNGDRVAQDILRAAGAALAQFAFSILACLFPEAGTATAQPQEGKAPIVSYVGGAFRSDFVLSTFREAVHAKYPWTEICPPAFSPVLGSLLVAYRSAGIRVSEDVYRQWAATLPPETDLTAGRGR
jgi:N-acetylglucosamine kinase-like BadF-type ATPase